MQLCTPNKALRSMSRRGLCNLNHISLFFLFQKQVHSLTIQSLDVSQVIFTRNDPLVLTGPNSASEVHLLYYDGLACQEQASHRSNVPLHLNDAICALQPILLSVFPGQGTAPNPNPALNDAPPLERVIATKWPESKVDWNGTEPIL